MENEKKIPEGGLAAGDVVNQFTGERWYYSDIVKEHFFNPRNLMLEDPDESAYDATGMVGSPACLDPKTIVWTNPEPKIITNIETKERVLSHDSLYHAVERVLRVRSPKGTLIKIRNYLGELTATEDHLIYAKQIPSRSTYWHHAYKAKVPSAWAHAGELKKGDIALYPLPTAVKHIDILTMQIERGPWDYKSIVIPEHIPVTAALLELFGYFIAEGSTRDTELQFTFGGEELYLAKRVRELVENIFNLRASIKERPKNHRIDVSIYNVHLAKNFRRLCGRFAVEKRVPEEFMLLAPQLQQSLIMGLWRGDGHFRNETKRQPRAGFTTISKVLSPQLIFLLLRQRIVPSLFYEQAKRINGVSHQGAFRLHVGDMESLERLAAILGIHFRRDKNKRHDTNVWFEDNYACIPITSVERIPFAGGRLYNFEIAESHTYATNAFLVHNCGDMMRMWLKIEPVGEKVKEMKWRTFGCGSAIAATSMFSVMVTENGGLPLAEALKIKPQHIMERLGGLPDRKIHCSVLADKAFRKAANDYFRRTGQRGRIIIEGARVVDPVLNITDKDIEEAVLEGATDLEAVQRKLKVGVGSPELITEVEQLIRFYKEKYYG